MRVPGFKDWIFSEDKKPYFVGSNGLVQEGDPVTFLKPDGQPAHLQNAPDGWQDSLVKYGSSLTYMGLFREMTVPMRFVKDGAKILRHLYFNKGMEGVAYYAKHKLDRQSYPHQYNPWYMGEPDFSKFKRIRNGVSIQIMEGGISKMFRAAENTAFEIPINTDIDKQMLYLDGLPFRNSVDWTVYNGQVVEGDTLPHYKWLGMGIISQEGTSQGIIVQDVADAFTTVFPNDSYFFWSVSKTVQVRVHGRITGVCTHDNGGAGSVLILNMRKASDSSNTVIQDVPLTTGTTYYKDQKFVVDFDTTITVNPHERLYMRMGATPWTQPLFTVEGTEISADYEVTFDPTYCEFLTPYTLAKRLVDKMFKGKYGLKSDFLMNLTDLGYTGGTALRKYGATSSIKTSFADFFQDLRTKGKKGFSVGLGIEGDNLVIEELDYFFRSDVIMDLGIVFGVEVYETEDLQFNTIKVGYKNQEVDKVNGRDEFNVTQTYNTPHTRVVKELDLMSPYRFDMYGIEVTRLDLYGKDTTDNKADNETFGIGVKKQPNVDELFYTGAFETEINAGQYYIKVPSIISTIIPNGLQIVIAGAVGNNGAFTIENTSYLVVGYTTYRVREAVTAESITGTLTKRNHILWHLNRPAYTTITGLLHPAESFNIPYSPKRCFNNCDSYMHSLLNKQDHNQVEFLKGDKNSELLTVEAGVTVEEKAHVPIGSMRPKLFLPHYIKFTTKVPFDFETVMKTNPYGRIKLTDGDTGKVLYGRMWDGGIKPEPRDKQDWILIASPNNDFTQLI